MIETFFLSPPRRDWALRARANFRSADAPPVDARKARKEWLAFAERLEALGGRVIVLGSPDSQLTGMPFAAEAGHMLEGPRFLLPRMFAEHRRAEAHHWATMCEKLHIETAQLESGFFEAQGDVADFMGVTLVFHGVRSDREGAELAAAMIEGETLLVEIRKPAFHGNMALLPLAHARMALVCREVVAPESMHALERRFGHEAFHDITLDELQGYATNALPIGDTILAPSSFPKRITALLTARGYKVEHLDMGELCGKAGGASRCLVCRSNIAITHVPIEHTLAHFREEIYKD
jgi:N-dimethylarginine dimethylaminohydrolase